MRGNCHEQIINKVSSSNRYWSGLYGILGLWGFSIAPNTFIKPALAILTVLEHYLVQWQDC